MIIFHAGFFEGLLHLWGETPPDQIDERNIPARKQALPLDAGASRLIVALGEVLGGVSLDESDTVEAHVWLPGIAGQPVASSPLIAEPPAAKTPATIAAWTVATLPLTTAKRWICSASRSGAKRSRPVWSSDATWRSGQRRCALRAPWSRAGSFCRCSKPWRIFTARGDEHFLDAMETIYSRTAPHALDAFVGGSGAA